MIFVQYLTYGTCLFPSPLQCYFVVCSSRLWGSNVFLYFYFFALQKIKSAHGIVELLWSVGPMEWKKPLNCNEKQ